MSFRELTHFKSRIPFKVLPPLFRRRSLLREAGGDAEAKAASGLRRRGKGRAARNAEVAFITAAVYRPLIYGTEQP